MATVNSQFANLCLPISSRSLKPTSSEKSILQGGAPPTYKPKWNWSYKRTNFSRYRKRGYHPRYTLDLYGSTDVA